VGKVRYSREKYAYKILIGKLLGRLKNTCEANIKGNLREIHSEGSENKEG
jgi:hypothetical protein